MLDRLDHGDQDGMIRLARSIPYPPLASAGDLQVRPLTGGLNHTVFAVEGSGKTYCLKLYAESARDQAAREWWALQRFWPLGLAPEPLGYEKAGNLVHHGAILMEYVPGSLLASVSSGHHVLAVLLPALTAVYGVHVGEEEPPWIATGHPLNSLDDWLNKAVAAYDRAVDGAGAGIGGTEEPLIASLIQVARGLIRDADCFAFGHAFCRGDPNLTNVIVEATGRVRFIDWEYSGLGDPAYEYADYIHHPSCESIPRELWQSALTSFPPALADAGFTERLHLYDVLIDIWWCLRLARYLLEVKAGWEHRPQKTDPALLAETRRRLSDRVHRVAARVL